MILYDEDNILIRYRVEYGIVQYSTVYAVDIASAGFPDFIRVSTSLHVYVSMCEGME